MLVKINFKSLIAAIAALVVFIMSINGQMAKIIHFSGVLNEILFAFVALMIFIVSAALSFERQQNVNNLSK